MLRLVLIGVGVLTTAVAGYLGQRKLGKLLSPTPDVLPLPADFPPIIRLKKVRRPRVGRPSMDDGDGDGFGPVA